MKQLKEQLEEMTRLGVIESVEEPTEWCAGMVAVPKPGGKLRICVDLTKLNQYIRENYPLPATEHILGQLGNACYFSKLDTNSGFWQFGLAKESQKLTTFITPFGRKMTQLLGKIEGVVCFMDDVVVYGSSLEEHNERVRQVLKKLQEEGMTLNPEKFFFFFCLSLVHVVQAMIIMVAFHRPPYPEKCQFGVKTIKLLGHTISSEGLFIDEEKLDAVIKMEEPRSAKELKSFLGMVNYLGKFIPNLADKIQPLNSLLSTKNEWVWEEPQKKSFNLLKQELASRPNLALYNPSRLTIISADASSFGIGGVLRQEQPDGSLKPVAYVSRTLSETERRYSQIEKGLAIEAISKRHENELEEELSAYIRTIEFPATEERLLEISRKQKEDSLCSQVANYCTGGWPKNKIEVDPEIRGYWQFKDDLTYQNGLLRGQRILIPRSMRGKRTLKNCTKAILGSINADLEQKSRYPEISLLQNLTAQEVINRLKSIFARNGTPETVRSDNGPQFQKVLGSKFSRFSKEWSFKHITSSPRFPQSNGFIEAIIKNIKQSLKKEEDCYLTLQAYRTISTGKWSSLMPRYLDSKALQEREKRRMINQKHLYDKRHDVHSLPQLQHGDSVWIRDQRVEGKVLHKSQEPRSFWVQTPQGKVRRNRLHLTRLPTTESTMDPPEDSRRQELRNEEAPPSTSTGQTRKCKDDQNQETEEDCPTSKTSPTRKGRTRSENQDQDQERSLPSTPVVQTRYGRVVKKPQRFL
ncbi:K02A2.6-like [Cordylochernes scorpioides]|uniref:K02A2.6-like n=1 Tax=Cordylochernes scorpioides TaxID=51811 RepID=A0ABY6KHW8_9ARAC|nr:K02A2.6-like [Cordylochernes scorpioides]